ncbi:hypothetical protein [Phyllobacterium phragmitis]|uniref:hypothetical protein n=1 Tax=Phyllobacterium phragmitis TaxID=2670329 RepID=UPI0011B23259|nr:hypothetical protein [Phyllobacterium phragmitis]
MCALIRQSGIGVQVVFSRKLGPAVMKATFINEAAILPLPVLGRLLIVRAVLFLWNQRTVPILYAPLTQAVSCFPDLLQHETGY